MAGAVLSSPESVEEVSEAAQTPPVSMPVSSWFWIPSEQVAAGVVEVVVVPLPLLLTMLPEEFCAMAASWSPVAQNSVPSDFATQISLVRTRFAKISVIPFPASANQALRVVLRFVKKAVAKDSEAEPGRGVVVPAMPSKFRFISLTAWEIIGIRET